MLTLCTTVPLGVLAFWGGSTAAPWAARAPRVHAAGRTLSPSARGAEPTIG